MCQQSKDPSLRSRYLEMLFVLSNQAETALDTWQTVQVTVPAKDCTPTHDSCRRYRSHSGSVHMQIAGPFAQACQKSEETTKSADDWPKCSRVAPWWGGRRPSYSHCRVAAFSNRILMAICMLNFIWKFKWFHE